MKKNNLFKFKSSSEDYDNTLYFMDVIMNKELMNGEINKGEKFDYAFIVFDDEFSIKFVKLDENGEEKEKQIVKFELIEKN